ncbi:zinc finger protein [Tanacetum coccineum]|uniref:Zinc finger protein n=1 Tax=Tanacetum coccineum TaxID=301880 RepID=A0ABQ5GQZ3_9ASTR
MSDFWTDGKGRCLINFLVNCPIGTIFLKSIDASEHVKDAQLIVEMINEVIEDVGEENILQTRWTDQLHHPLHAAGCFLNPAIFHAENSKVSTNNEILTDLYVAIDRLVPDPDENDSVREQLNMYIDSAGQFGSDSAKRTRTKFAPYIWWRSYGIDTPLLQRFAIRRDKDEWNDSTENELQGLCNALMSFCCSESEGEEMGGNVDVDQVTKK